MKNKSLFFVATLSLFVTFFFTSCGSDSEKSLVFDLQSQNQTLAEANQNKDILIASQQKRIEELEKEKNNPVKISTDNFNYYELYGSGQNKFYKIISIVIFSDPIITEGVEGDDGGQIVEFILESIEPNPVRVIGSETYYYDEKGNSTIPSKVKLGEKVTFQDLFEGQEGG